jgi:SAM-dependent methyltransferase
MGGECRHICPVEKAGLLDNLYRRLIQNPYKILKPHVRDGITAMDFGCGPGFFTIPLAQLVGKTGRVIAVDLQEEMLQIVKEKCIGTEIEERIVLHRCDINKIGISECVDFILLFYMVHEVPDKAEFFHGIRKLLRPTGHILLVEPLFHVSKLAFEQTLDTARDADFSVSGGPKLFMSRTAILQKTDSVRAQPLNSSDGKGPPDLYMVTTIAD